MTKLAYSHEVVKTADCISGPVRYIENAADKNDWRYLTSDEKADYESWLASDHARADDDGMGQAVGVEFPNDNDLGADWGAFDQGPVDPAVAKIAEVMGSNTHAVFDGGRGKAVTVEAERALADQAIKFINESVGNSKATRYTLVVYHMDMDTFNIETTGAKLKSYSLVSTADRRALVGVVEAELYSDMLANFPQDAATTLDVE